MFILAKYYSLVALQDRVKFNIYIYSVHISITRTVLGHNFKQSKMQRHGTFFTVLRYFPEDKISSYIQSSDPFA
jgi:hypothetical protein